MALHVTRLYRKETEEVCESCWRSLYLSVVLTDPNPSPSAPRVSHSPHTHEATLTHDEPTPTEPTTTAAPSTTQGNPPVTSWMILTILPRKIFIRKRKKKSDASSGRAVMIFYLIVNFVTFIAGGPRAE